jgi:effector-binding domain-containing protein
VPGADTTVVAEATPAGVAATVTHVGPYPEVGRAHDAIHAWARQQGHRLAGPNWEVYDHPQDGQPPRVDVFYLLG